VFQVGISAGRIRAAEGKPDAASSLRSVIGEATRLGFVPFQLEARLALGELEMKLGANDTGRADLKSLEKDATARNFLLIARKAHTAAAVR
jgi:hypothetical protein